jgi:hypothetical protein
MDLTSLLGSIVADLSSTTTGVPAVAAALMPVLFIFIGVKLVPKLIKRWAK